jgi:hypothetical protein
LAKKQYLKKYDSGWGKMHELLIKDNEDVFKNNLNHLQNYTEFQSALVPAEFNQLVELKLQKFSLAENEKNAAE